MNKDKSEVLDIGINAYTFCSFGVSNTQSNTEEDRNRPQKEILLMQSGKHR